MTDAWVDPSDDEAEAEYSMVWRFVNQSHDFMLGIECGQIAAKMQAGESPIRATVHAENDEELLNAANTFGYQTVLEELNEDWRVATFTRAGEPS